MNNVDIFELLTNVSEQLEKITLNEFLNVMTMVGKKIKTERKKVKETGSLSTKEIEST